MSWPQPPQCDLTLDNADQWRQKTGEALARCQDAPQAALLDKAALLHSDALRERLAQGSDAPFIAGLLAAQTVEDCEAIALKRVIMANARYWLDYLNVRTEDHLSPDPDIQGVAQALEAVMAVPEAWPLTQALTLALHPYMEWRGYWAEWDDFLRCLSACARQHEVDPADRARLLDRRGAIQRQRGDYQAAVLSYRRAWTLYRQSGDQSGRATALSNLGDLCRLRGYFRRAEALCRGALTLFEVLGDTARLAQTENHLGLIYFDQRRWAEAMPHLARSKALLEQVDDRHGLAKTLHNLGELYRHTGDPEAALAHFRQAIHHYQAVGDETHIARTQLNIGNVYLNQSDLLRAERAYSRAEIVLKRRGGGIDLARARHNLGIVYTRLENWTEAEACFERALEQWRNQGDTWNLANTLGELSGLYFACAHWNQARACLEEAWEITRERQEVYYESLQRELLGRWQELRHSTGSRRHEDGVGPGGNLEPTPPV